MSQPPDPHQAANLLFKLRALFGLQARAEVMAYLLVFESGHPGEMAERLAYFRRTLQTTLNDLERSGHLLTRREGREKRFWLRREEWRFLITWPAAKTGSPAEFPAWVDWAARFAALEAIWKFLNHPGLRENGRQGASHRIARLPRQIVPSIPAGAHPHAAGRNRGGVRRIGVE